LRALQFTPYSLLLTPHFILKTGVEMFIPLRVHSVYSRGKGAATLQELALWAAQQRLPAAALTDIENFYGWAGWKKAALRCGLAPLFGCEMELEGSRFLFLVKNRQGYWNLMEIFNQKKIKETEGLVVILIPKPGQKPPLQNLESVTRGDFYLGADFFNFKQAPLLAEEYRLPLVWTNPLKFIKDGQRLVLVHSIHKKIPFPPEWARLKQKVRLFGPDQEGLAIKKFGSEIKPLFQTTFEVAEKCSFSLKNIIPSLPEDIFPTTLRQVVMRKLRSRRNLRWEERARAKRELAVVEESGFGPYFLIVHDVVDFARRRGILHNLKGSGASSYLAYLLGISHINPLQFDLYFARFLNKGRDDPPDFDLDFDSRRRDEVLSYVLHRYSQGPTGAAFVCSLKNFRARSALYETARAFGLSPQEARSLSQKAPFFAPPSYLKEGRPPPGCREIWKVASELTSVYCTKSLHVGGVILTPSPLSRHLPLEESVKGYTMTHYDRDAVEDLKLIKLDLLSVRGLAAISETKKRLRLSHLPPHDEKAYRLLQRAETIGCLPGYDESSAAAETREYL